jgi:hypothetical protein
MAMSIKTRRSGFLLIDALIGVTIASLLSVVFLTIIFNASVGSTHARDRFSASLTELEVYEVLVSLAQDDFDAVLTAAISCPCYVEHDGSTWSIESGTETIGGRFERTFTVDTVNRDGAGDIVESGGSLDPDTLEINITANWTTRGVAKTENLTAYIHRIN